MSPPGDDDDARCGSASARLGLGLTLGLAFGLAIPLPMYYARQWRRTVVQATPHYTEMV